ncbi:MerR family DNA-binding transcriptional regulator [Pseudoclavibacter sp. Marseille-Q4354]|nr:MerR family DNA-binding transcriptional regulator [Pseudoclavibacter sp. Marseille-Q4354]
MRISEVSKRSGISATALRYYESIGLVTPHRSSNGSFGRGRGRAPDHEAADRPLRLRRLASAPREPCEPRGRRPELSARPAQPARARGVRVRGRRALQR